MTQKAVNNAKVLYRLNISRSDVEEAHKIFTKAPFLLETLTNPVVSEEAKEVVLDKIARQSGMPELLENFMKMMCRIGEIGQITDIFNCYYEYWDKMNHILHAKVIYADDKAKEEKEAIKAEIKAGLEGLAGQIPGLLEIHVNTNGLESSNADLMLDSTFTDEAALKGYSVHPAHVAVANGKVRPHTAIRSCLDFTV